MKNKLMEGWTPEIIAGSLTLNPKQLSISHESIYLYIYKKRPEKINNRSESGHWESNAIVSKQSKVA